MHKVLILFFSLMFGFGSFFWLATLLLGLEGSWSYFWVMIIAIFALAFGGRRR